MVGFGNCSAVFAIQFRGTIRSMTPKITPEIRQAIDEHHGQPVFVVDSDRHETFVLLSDTDFARVSPLLGHGNANDNWTDEKNDRRCDLIDKQIQGSIELEERAELEFLQRQFQENQEKKWPLPIAKAKELHAELLEKKRRRQQANS